MISTGGFENGYHSCFILIMKYCIRISAQTPVNSFAFIWVSFTGIFPNTYFKGQMSYNPLYIGMKSIAHTAA
jgi:hypothetical protein